MKTQFATCVRQTIGVDLGDGRNYQNWFSQTADVRERYDYLYTVDELEPWVDHIKAVSHKARDTYAVTNNHHVGKAVTNALEISSLLSGKPVKAPPPLLGTTPRCRNLQSSRRLAVMPVILRAGPRPSSGAPRPTSPPPCVRARGAAPASCVRPRFFHLVGRPSVPARERRPELPAGGDLSFVCIVA